MAVGADTAAARSTSKRLLDVVGAAAMLVVTAPLLAVTAVAVAIDVGHPVLFRQQRPGLRGRPFTMLKFRTMRQARDTQARVLPDQDRLTTLGRILRSTSLDELPELLNVLRGEMSLVGPRPLLVDYLARYSPTQRRRHEAKPGITGWAQVNGRNALTWPEKFELDVWYVENWTLGLDLKILVMTVATILRRSGISHQGDATMPEFMG